MKLDRTLILNVLFAVIVALTIFSVYREIITNRQQGIIDTDQPPENFNISPYKSSAWGWNTPDSYGSGYGTGYSYYGTWPGSIPTRPWKSWMWAARMPPWQQGQQVQMPQIDYGYIRT